VRGHVLGIILIAFLIAVAGAMELNAYLDLAYVRSHPVIKTVTKVVYVKVYYRSPDVNELLYRGHELCLGDGGLGAAMIFPAVKENAEFLCAFGHRAYTQSGMQL
jgi:hypothetical protein